MWPAVLLHAAMAVWCITTLLRAETAHGTKQGQQVKVAHEKALRQISDCSLGVHRCRIDGSESCSNTLLFWARPNFPKTEEWVLSQGAVESIAPELAAILGVGSDRLPVKLKSYRTSDGISLAFAVSTNPKQEGIVISALKTIADKMKIYSVGTAWLTDRSGTLRRTIAVDASGARVVPDSSRASEFKNIKAFFVKKLQATSPSTAASPSPRISATAAGGKERTRSSKP